ncbi:MAG: cobalamin-binding protein [Gammaproteobacteria bacterium]|nr:MAG: cobalamin-binding protein [Gammaproteobacteria bacterium]
MIKRIVLGCTLFFSIPAFACTVVDDAGTTVHLTQPAQHIISLAPHVTETLFAIGAGRQVVGVIHGSDYPPEARGMKQVGDYQDIDLETILRLHPDLIITWGQSFSRQLITLKKFGIPVYVTQPRQLEDLPRTMKQLGCLAGTEKTAQAAADDFSHHLAALRQHYAQQKPVTVFYQIGSYSLMTLNKDSWVNQVITLCGGHNVFANATMIAPEVSWESAIAANPQVIIDSSNNDQWKTEWQRWPTVAAVKNHFLFTINPDLLERAGPRLLEGAAQVCRYLQVARLN